MKRHGFSLVELSIVLVILGLLTGGILAGQSLIRASELRAMTTEYQRYTAAWHTFRDKYFAMPGDFRDATKFWGRLNNTPECVTNSSATVLSPGACDGDSNGTVSIAPTAGQSGEEFQTWRHLALAGLIEGNYSGLAGPSATDDLQRGTNVPASKFANTYWRIYNMPTAANAFNYVYGTVLNGGATSISGGGGNVALKPEELWNIDTKMDDGKPGTGNIIARPWNTNCTTAANANDFAASYALSETVARCLLVSRGVLSGT